MFEQGKIKAKTKVKRDMSYKTQHVDWVAAIASARTSWAITMDDLSAPFGALRYCVDCFAEPLVSRCFESGVREGTPNAIGSKTQGRTKEDRQAQSQFSCQISSSNEPGKKGRRSRRENKVRLESAWPMTSRYSRDMPHRLTRVGPVAPSIPH